MVRHPSHFVGRVCTHHTVSLRRLFWIKHSFRITIIHVIIRIIVTDYWRALTYCCMSPGEQIFGEGGGRAPWAPWSLRLWWFDCRLRGYKSNCKFRAVTHTSANRGGSTLGPGGHRPPKYWPGPPNILVPTAKIRIVKIYAIILQWRNQHSYQLVHKQWWYYWPKSQWRCK